MDSIKALLIISFLFCIPVVLASQPALPTLIHGKITNTEGVPKVGSTVTASFTDSAGNPRTLTTQTLSDGDVIGKYFFNQGFLQAAQGTTILIETHGQKREIAADPGGPIVQIPIIQVSPEEEKKEEDDSQVPEIDTPPQTQNQFTAKQGMITTEATAGGNALPTLPTTLYGQLVDEYGEPVGGEEVTIRWLDENGKLQATTTETISEEEAEELGNESLEGFFALNEGEINAQENTTIFINSSKATASVESNPGESVRTDLLVPLSNFEAIARKDKEIKSTRRSPINNTKAFFKAAGREIKEISPIIGYTILSIAGLTLIVIIYISRRKIQTYVKNSVMTRLHRHTHKLVNKKVQDFMCKNIVTVQPTDPVTKALQILVNENIGCLVVAQGNSPFGLLTERDLLRRLDLNADLSKIKIESIMSKPVKTISPEMTFTEAMDYSLEHDIRKMPVTEKGKLVGLITQTDLAKEFQNFLRSNTFEDENVPIVRSATSDNILVSSENESVEGVLKPMLEKNADTIIVTENKDDGTEEMIGLFTERDIIAEVFNNPQRLNKFHVGAIMSRNLFTITPGTPIFEANNLMIEKEVRRLPVTTSKKIVGIITQTGILQAINDFIKHLAKSNIEDVAKAVPKEEIKEKKKS